MERAVKNRTILEEFVLDFVHVLEKHVKYVIVSGFVAIIHGRVRGTEDIDVIIEKMPLEKYSTLHDALIKDGFECVQTNDGREAYSYLAENLSIRYVRKGTFVPEMEVKFAKDEIDKEQILTRKKIVDRFDAYFSSIEATIAFKEEYLKSEKDLEDAKHLRKVCTVSEEEIERIKKMIRRLR